MAKIKKIEIVHLKPSELKTAFGNPRKITNENLEELKKSLEKFGDHDIVKIDEVNNIISGNQRVEALLQLGIDMPILCKKLVGFTAKELKRINIDSNKHAGDWDYDLLEVWENEMLEDDDIGIIDDDDFITTQKQKSTQENMVIKIGNFEVFVKKDQQPKSFDVFFSDQKDEYQDVILRKIEELATEISRLI